MFYLKLLTTIFLCLITTLCSAQSDQSTILSLQRWERNKWTFVGTGTYFRDGYILTCHHVVFNRSAKVMYFFDTSGRLHQTSLLAYDEERDCALLRASTYRSLSEGHQLSDKVPASEAELWAFGNFTAANEGLKTSYGKCVNHIDCNFHGEGSNRVYPGFSGGPVINAQGRLVGIVSQHDAFNWNVIYVRADVIRRFLEQEGYSFLAR